MTIGLEGRCSIQLSYGTAGRPPGRLDTCARAGRRSMRPGRPAVIAEILRIGNLAALGFLRLLDAEGEPFLLGIGHRFFPGVEGQPDLASHVAGGRIAHQRVDFLARFRIEFQHPVAGLGLAGLHRGFGWAENARGHGHLVIVQGSIATPRPSLSGRAPLPSHDQDRSRR